MRPKIIKKKLRTCDQTLKIPVFTQCFACKKELKFEDSYLRVIPDLNSKGDNERSARLFFFCNECINKDSTLTTLKNCSEQLGKKE